MTCTTERSVEVAKMWKIPEVQDLPVAAKLAIELALLAESCRGVEDSYRMGQIRGLRRARNLPRFTFRALGKHIMGYVSLTAIEAELWKLDPQPPMRREYK